MKELLLIAVGAVFATTTIYSLQYLEAERKRKHVKKVLDEIPFTPISETAPSAETDTLEMEQLSRMSAFVGTDALSCIRSSFVIVVGLGGVGSHAAVHLVRSGVGRVRMVDFDQVTLSSLNRHAVAIRADVGTPKVVTMQRFFGTLFPSTQVDACVELFDMNSAARLLSGKPDYVLDCIDNVPTKIDLLRYCHSQGIKVISSMGSACKSDPSLVRITDIEKTYDDRLAKVVRTRLRKFGIRSGIKVVFSAEPPHADMTIALPSEDDPSEFAALPNFRARILPVFGPIPAMFGAAMAASVLKDIATLK